MSSFRCCNHKLDKKAPSSFVFIRLIWTSGVLLAIPFMSELLIVSSLLCKWPAVVVTVCFDLEVFRRNVRSGWGFDQPCSYSYIHCTSYSEDCFLNARNSSETWHAILQFKSQTYEPEKHGFLRKSPFLRTEISGVLDLNASYSSSRFNITFVSLTFSSIQCEEVISIYMNSVFWFINH